LTITINLTSNEARYIVSLIQKSKADLDYAFTDNIFTKFNAYDLNAQSDQEIDEITQSNYEVCCDCGVLIPLAELSQHVCNGDLS
jgi:RNA polymerase-binding transcription factor DksA